MDKTELFDALTDYDPFEEEFLITAEEAVYLAGLVKADMEKDKLTRNG